MKRPALRKMAILSAVLGLPLILSSCHWFHSYGHYGGHGYYSGGHGGGHHGGHYKHRRHRH